MTDSLKSKLQCAGVNYQDALDRFMNNEPVLERLLYKFPNDTSFQQLCAALQNNDCEQAFLYAHTLKGIAANLSLTLLHHNTSQLVEALRQKNLSLSQQLFTSVVDNYKQIINALRECDN